MTIHRYFSTAALGVSVCLASLSGCKKQADETEQPTVTVQAEKVAVGSLTETVEADTVLQPQAQSAIVPKISSPVKQFYVQRGSRVHAGQVLASLENADLAASVVDTKGTLTQAQATYKTTTGASVLEEMKTAEANVEQAKANLEVQKMQTDARQNLLAQGAIPRRDYETARAALVQAQDAYDVAAQHLASLKGVSRAAEIQNAEGAVASARGKYEAAQSALNYSTVRSPIDGVVTDRPLFPGEMAQAGQPLITVMDTSMLLAKVHLPQTQIAGLHVGDKAAVTVQGADQSADGSLSLISPALDPGSTTVEVWVKVPNKSGALKPGMPVHVAIEARTLKDITTVPTESVITNKSGGTAVMVVGSDGLAHEREVKLGVTDGKDTQVLTGVQPGEIVVTTGAHSLEDKTKVEVGPAESGDSGDSKGGDEKSPDKATAGEGK
jgi:multidrug efflux pump subunit AcrA (membrane-fusion protein)